jgi:thiamine biosynthesis lipoprotein
VDDETAALLDFAFAAYEKSDGLFDISSGLLRRAWNFDAGVMPSRTVLDALLERIGLHRIAWSNRTLRFGRPGMEIDFGGIGKEYAADRAVAVLRSYNLAHALVDLGGDFAAAGPRADGTPWAIAVRHPRRPDATLASVPLSGGGLASSGDYERYFERDGQRYCHILDPRDGMPCRGLQAASVCADTCLAAGVFATTAMLMGTNGAAWLAERGLPHLVVDDAGRPRGTLLG